MAATNSTHAIFGTQNKPSEAILIMGHESAVDPFINMNTNHYRSTMQGARVNESIAGRLFGLMLDLAFVFLMGWGCKTVLSEQEEEKKRRA